MSFRLTRVEAPTMDEALQKVRSMLGSDAMIVKTRAFRRGGVLGFGGREVVEVFAADTRSRIENIKRENSNRNRQPTSPVPTKVNDRDEQPQGIPEPPPLAELGDSDENGDSYAHFASALTQIRQEIRQFVARTGGVKSDAHPFLAECYELLITHDVDPQVADRIVQQVAKHEIPDGFPGPTRVRAEVHAALVEMFVAPPPLETRKKPRLIALVGPTGVGKTTTIAKLAARAKINERLRVGLVTLDTFRIAAIDQLEKYAEIIGLPLAVASKPQELCEVIDEFREREVDLVFIDSAGRNQRDEIKMAELRAFLSVLPDVEAHLVLSTTTHFSNVENIASRFMGIDFKGVILTKIDETVSFGSLLKSLLTIGRPVAFITDGQNVPDDIMTGEPERLADLVLKTNAR